ncbi:MAG: SUMF1/EgtB/PvdO family nonheme iron enzyme [Flavobacteriales bacterium]
MIDARKLNYRYRQPDSHRDSKEGESRKGSFVEKEVNVYPDTAVWVKDFHFSHNEPLQMKYFSHEAYSEYPVVGVSWYQANAFCVWRTNYKNGYQKSRRKPAVFPFRLPTETEWEYAARGGIANEPYPWGGPYLTDERGRFLANFKPRRGDYLADGAMYTAKARSYYPNRYNLYNMAGNVAEWTSSTYKTASYYAYKSLNPTLKLKGYDENNPRKVVRGGSWKDVGYYLQVSTRDFEYADSARSYIGFRTVQDYPNRLKIRKY